MVFRSAKLLAVMIILAVLAAAQVQVATVTSDSPFQLRGAGVQPGQGVPSWPVMPGDTIQAGQTPLTVTFADGSTIVLAPGASAKISLSGATPVFQLLSGSAHYSLKTDSSVKLLNAKGETNRKDLVGDMQIGGPALAAGWWTTGHTLVVLGASAGAAGLAVGVVQANKVSKSNCGNGNGKGNNC